MTKLLPFQREFLKAVENPKYNGFAAFVHSLGLVLVLVGFLTIILACGAEKPNVTPIGTIAPTPRPTPRVIVATTATPMPSSTQRVIAADTPVRDHHSRTDGDPGANGYRCPYCNSRTNSYSYASAAYSHTATPGE